MRILIVEDDHKLANAMKRGLEQESYAVDLEDNGDDGLDSALTDDYDLVILDRMIPGNHDGLGILKKMRQEKKKTPVIFVTAKDKVEDKVEGLNLGADDYLVKPFAFEELLARIRALLRRPQENISAVLEYEDLTLDTINFEVRRAGQYIALTTKEFALLQYLMRNSERILTKDNIINHVWDFDSDILPNTVEVYIGYLRTKIDKPFTVPPLIHTHRGFGYYLGKRK